MRLGDLKKKMKSVQNCLKWREIGFIKFEENNCPPPTKGERVTFKKNKIRGWGLRLGDFCLEKNEKWGLR